MMSKFSPKVHLVDWDKISLEDLKTYKMDVGTTKYGDPNFIGTAEYVANFIRKGAEFIIATGSGDTREMMEVIADIANVCEILFPKLQADFIESMGDEPPYCYGTDHYNSLQCRSDICDWRTDCGQVSKAKVGKALREVDERAKDIHSTRNE